MASIRDSKYLGAETQHRGSREDREVGEMGGEEEAHSSNHIGCRALI